MQFESWLKLKVPGVSQSSAEAVLAMAAEGATVPFMARYRKEKTGNLDEVQIRDVIDFKEKWDELLKRQIFVAAEIEKQGKLTDDLKKSLFATFDMDRLEDLYLPYKLKRKTKAMLAKEAGLETLAEWLLAVARGEKLEPAAVDESSLQNYAKSFINAEKKFETEAAVIQGALDILTERLSENLALRDLVRAKLRSEGFLRSKKGAKAKTPSKFENYFDFGESINSLFDAKNSHRYLAMRRGWMEEELALNFGGGPAKEETFESDLISRFEKELSADRKSLVQTLLQKSARQAFKAFIFPSIETEFHRLLKESSDAVAISVFADNVRNLLLSSPYGAKAVLGVDPGIRTGCKLAIVNSAGQYVASTVMNLQTPIGQKEAAKILLSCVNEAKISAVAVGNGTAGRETETFIRQTLKEAGLNIPAVVVNESGASIYSASDVAREEFPDLDITVRGAISIARRFQDPLAELVKLDPKSIGVGQYQHDVSQPQLKKSLEGVVDSCVNFVGVNLNTASYHLLGRVSGIGPSLAKSIVEHRSKNGIFKSRDELLTITRFSKKSFEQAAGFLRIPNSENPLDNTGVHPESYPLLETWAQKMGKKVRDLIGAGASALKAESRFKSEAGEFTFQDIVKELEKPGLDPREEFVPFSFREDIHEIKDLVPNMTCPGVVTNVTNFGAFVDIGVHQDGLVHISQIADRFVKDPREVVKPGDRVTVRVLEVNQEKRQIALTMKSENPVQTQHTPRRDSAPRGHDASRADNRPRNQDSFRRPDNRPSRDFQNSGPGQARPMPARSNDQARPKASEFRNNAFSQLGDLAKALAANAKGSSRK